MFFFQTSIPQLGFSSLKYHSNPSTVAPQRWQVKTAVWDPHQEAGILIADSEAKPATFGFVLGQQKTGTLKGVGVGFVGFGRFFLVVSSKFRTEDVQSLMNWAEFHKGDMYKIQSDHRSKICSESLDSCIIWNFQQQETSCCHFIFWIIHLFQSFHSIVTLMPRTCQAVHTFHGASASGGGRLVHQSTLHVGQRCQPSVFCSLTAERIGRFVPHKKPSLQK